MTDMREYISESQIDTLFISMGLNLSFGFSKPHGMILSFDSMSQKRWTEWDIPSLIDVAGIWRQNLSTAEITWNNLENK